MSEPKRLYRSRDDRMLAGVAGGLAEYFGIDPTVVRVLWVVLSIFPGSIIGGVIVYAVLALVIPEKPATATTGAHHAAQPPAEPPAQ